MLRSLLRFGLLPSLVALSGAALGCAGETADVRAKFVASRSACSDEVKVVHRDTPSSVPEDAPDRDKLLALLSAPKPGHDYYDVHGCGGGAVFDCFDEMSYREDGASRKVRHCGPIATWTQPGAAPTIGFVYEATDGSTHEAPDDKTMSVSNRAAIASAAHDLPCDAASTHVVGTDAEGRANAAEGCGLRATYELVPFVPQGGAARVASAAGLRYKLTARASVGAAP